MFESNKDIEKEKIDKINQELDDLIIKLENS